jgi:anthranilate phosphoribosyltransferase
MAKHGNRAVSSSCGSADVLEALGFAIEQPPERTARSIDELGFGFMFAPLHHPAMRHAAPVRRELAARTVFNLLGPLTNPAGARRQVVGVHSAALARTYAQVLARLGADHAFVVHGAGGVDELTAAGPNLVCEVRGSDVREAQLDPRELGIPRADVTALAGGSPADNAARLSAVLAGERGPARDAVVLNAAAALVAGGQAGDVASGLALASEAIDSGRAGSRLEELVAFSRGTDG